VLDPDRQQRADELLVERGAGDIDHPGGSLLRHLRRTRDLLVDLGAPGPLQLAGLCHAAYGTAGFERSLLTLDERPVLAAAIGDEAESLVHRYASCDRQATYRRLGTDPLVFTVRFTGEVLELEPAEATAFATITIANELDVLRHAALSPAERTGIVDLFASLSTYAARAAAFALREASDAITRRPSPTPR
jgi:hypothetical protein